MPVGARALFLALQRRASDTNLAERKVEQRASEPWENSGTTRTTPPTRLWETYGGVCVSWGDSIEQTKTRRATCLKKVYLLAALPHVACEDNQRPRRHEAETLRKLSTSSPIYRAFASESQYARSGARGKIRPSWYTAVSSFLDLIAGRRAGFQ